MLNVEEQASPSIHSNCLKRQQYIYISHFNHLADALVQDLQKDTKSRNHPIGTCVDKIINIKKYR